MGWASWLYDMGGELYWSVDFATVVNGGANGEGGWTNQFVAGGQGDGTLTYRGVPAVVGGAHEIPIASIRLKHARDAQEDWMLLAAAEAALGRPAVAQLISPLITSSSAFADDAQIMAEVRQVVMAAVVGE
jgi:hypothetical protein